MTSGSTGNTNNLATQIQELATLHQSGVLSDLEFARAKSILLGQDGLHTMRVTKPEPPSQPAVTESQPSENPPAPHAENLQLVTLNASLAPTIIRCGRCLTAIHITCAAVNSSCPECKAPLVVVNKGSAYLAKGVKAAWKQPWGVGLKLTGVGIALVSLLYGGYGLKNGVATREFDITEGAIQAATNPLVWISIILGIVWSNGIFRSGEFNASSTEWVRGKHY